MSELHDVELQRARWRRIRKSLRLVYSEAEDFGTGGLARFLRDPGARLLILPSDPETSRVEFDDATWQWLQTRRRNPFNEGVTDWGSRHQPTSTAAVIFDSDSAKQGVWSRYLGLHRHGGIEFGLGHLAAFEGNGQRFFRSIAIVGRVWVAMELYREVIERFGVSGPWEVTIALIGTKDAHLSHLARGWRDPTAGEGFSLPQCLEPNLLLRREVVAWPGPEAVEQFALSVGAWLDDSWGIPDRRVLSQVEPGKDRFDASKYRDF